LRPVRLPGPVKGLRIGLFGGSFNPAHTGHLHVAETAMKRLQLDWVWWIVARGNPLKTDHGDFNSRFASAEAVAGHHPRMIVTDIETAAGLYLFLADAADARRPRAASRFCLADGRRQYGGLPLLAALAGHRPADAHRDCRPARCGPGARNSRFARTFAKDRIPEAYAPLLPDTGAACLGLPEGPAGQVVLHRDPGGEGMSLTPAGAGPPPPPYPVEGDWRTGRAEAARGTCVHYRGRGAGRALRALSGGGRCRENRTLGRRPGRALKSPATGSVYG
jgi:nicotinate-nucleotide adenylyltransferase